MGVQYMSLERVKTIFPTNRKAKIIDIGANPIDGSPPYQSLWHENLASVLGFEPNKSALDKLESMKKPGDIFLDYAIGDGTKKPYFTCRAQGMSSNLEPNSEFLSLFQAYPSWSEILDISTVQTHRLDDIPQARNCDYIKIDVQGSELDIFKNSEEILKDVMIIHTETMFIEIYKDQPLFSDIEIFLRTHNFMFHTFYNFLKRTFKPLIVNNSPSSGLNQITTADCVFVKHPDEWPGYSEEKLVIFASILDSCYNSIDLSQSILKCCDDIYGTQYWKNYINKISA